MKNPMKVIDQKKVEVLDVIADLKRLEKELNALYIVAPMLFEPGEIPEVDMP